MVKNFYMDTKKGTLEQSVLDVWKDGEEVKEGAPDSRTKEYREHRKKLESVRQYRADAAKAVNKEAWEIGTKEYRKYLERITPGSVSEENKDSEELDTEPGKTSKKMKRAQEPAVSVATEALSKKQKKLDVDGDGEIEGSDLAKLRKKAKKEGKSELEVAKEFKVHSMKKALAQVWGFEEHKGNKPHKHPHEDNEKTDTGKKVAKVDVDPDLKEKKKKISAGKAY